VVESVHRGHLVAHGADGVAALVVGDPDVVFLPRSSLKPVQAVAMLRAGVELDGELLALACASHSGEPMHVDGVRRILAGAGAHRGRPREHPRLPAVAGRRARPGGPTGTRPRRWRRTARASTPR
jgi:hypothetical protein